MANFALQVYVKYVNCEVFYKIKFNLIALLNQESFHVATLCEQNMVTTDIDITVDYIGELYTVYTFGYLYNF